MQRQFEHHQRERDPTSPPPPPALSTSLLVRVTGTCRYRVDWTIWVDDTTVLFCPNTKSYNVEIKDPIFSMMGGGWA